MLDYKLLETLSVIAQEQSFDGAARHLRITQSAVSQRISALEDSLGQIVIIRTTPPKLTKVGEKILKHYKQVNALEVSLEEELANKESGQFVKISIGSNADSLATWLLPALEPVIKKNKILVEVVVDDQAETYKLIRTGEVMACLTSEKKTPIGCKSTYLGEMNYHCVATPEFKKEYFAKGVTKESLLKAPAIIYSRKDHMHAHYLSKYFKIKDQDYPYHLIPSSEGFVDVTLTGTAYSLVPSLQIKEYLKKGKLIDLTPGKYIPVKLYWHSWYLQTKHVDLVSDVVISYAQKMLKE